MTMQSRRIRRLSWVIAVAASAGFAACARAEVVYVDASAEPGGDGAAWATAFSDLQGALALAAGDPSIDEIRLAEGVYRPDGGSGDPALSFEIVSAGDLSLLGGYPAGGGSGGDGGRDPEAYPTVLSGDLAGDDSVTFEAGGGPVFVNNAENTDTVVEIAPASGVVTLDGLVITGGNSLGSGGGLSAEDRDVSLLGVVFRGNRASIDGGGAAISGRDAAIEVRGCVFELCATGGSGGGLSADGDLVEVAGSTFAMNAADFGGGLFAEGGRLFSGVEDCVFRDNTARFGGGGASIDGVMGLRDSRFVDNTAADGGGLRGGSGDRGIERCVFEGNAATDVGGAIQMHPHQLVVVDCRFLENSAGSRGGAIAVGNNYLTAVGSRFVRNASRDGGAIGGLALSSGVDIERCFFLANSATRDGGAIDSNDDEFGYSSMALRSSVFVGNSAGRNGGAIIGAEGTATNLTVAFNSADRTGGLASSHPIGVSGSIFWGNNIGDLFTQFSQLDGPFEVSDSIVEGLLPFGAYAGSGNTDEDPDFLDPLGPDGVAMSGDEDCRLRTGSPAIDRGGVENPSGVLELDAAGLPRFVGLSGGPAIIDRGAFEAQDCDADGTVDAEVILLGIADDCDSDGVIDGCAIGSLLDPRVVRLTSPEGSFQRTGFASDVAICGSHIMVLAPNYDDGNGTARVVAPFRRSESGWTPLPLVEGPVLDGKRTIPRQVAITGDLAVVGLQVEFEPTGPLAFYRFDDLAGSWFYDADLSTRVFTNQEEIFWSIDADEETIVCGTPRFSDSRGGAFYIETDEAGDWKPSQSLPMPARERGDQYGEDVAVWDDIIVVGAPSVDGSGINKVGAADVFRREDIGWVHEQRIGSPMATDPFFGFGTGVACGDGVIAVSATGNIESVVFLYEFVGQSWELVGELRPPGLPANAAFGRELAIDGGNLIASAPGAERVFVYNRVEGGWELDAVFESGMPASKQFYGQTVAIDGSVALVGEIGPFGAGVPSAWIYEPRVLDLDSNGRPDACDEACPVDAAVPFGVLDLADIVAFVTGFASQSPSADFAEPFGVFDLQDVVAFVTLFEAGCP